MYDVDVYLKVRYAVQIEGLSKRAAARRFGIDPRTVNKMMLFSVPRGYVRTKPVVRPKLDPFIERKGTLRLIRVSPSCRIGCSIAVPFRERKNSKRAGIECRY